MLDLHLSVELLFATFVLLFATMVPFVWKEPLTPAQDRIHRIVSALAAGYWAYTIGGIGGTLLLSSPMIHATSGFAVFVLTLFFWPAQPKAGEISMPGTGSGQRPPRPEQSNPALWIALLFAMVVAILSIPGLFREKPAAAQEPPRPQSRLPLVPCERPDALTIVLRIHGSNTIGSEAMLLLAAGFLRDDHKATDVSIAPVCDQQDEFLVRGLVATADGTHVETIEISAHGSETAFQDLNGDHGRTCDIGMSSRPIQAEEVARLARFGRMNSPACQFLVAYDGIGIVVNAANGLDALSTEDLRGILTGAITDWRQLPASHLVGPIEIYSRPRKLSGTYELIKQRVLLGRDLVPACPRTPERETTTPCAEEIEDSAELSDTVAKHTRAIGYIGLPFVRNAKALALSHGDLKPLAPTRMTIKTGEYALQRPLYLFSPEQPSNVFTRKFLKYADSEAGQKIVESAGFLSNALTIEDSSVGLFRRVSIDFRFERNSFDLDADAQTSLTKLVAELQKPQYANHTLWLFGNTDQSGPARLNYNLSIQRANAVKNALRNYLAQEESLARGPLAKEAIVAGVGANNPIASESADPIGASLQNRRVDVLLQR